MAATPTVARRASGAASVTGTPSDALVAAGAASPTAAANVPRSGTDPARLSGEAAEGALALLSVGVL